MDLITCCFKVLNWFAAETIFSAAKCSTLGYSIGMCSTETCGSFITGECVAVGASLLWTKRRILLSVYGCSIYHQYGRWVPSCAPESRGSIALLWRYWAVVQPAKGWLTEFVLTGQENQTAWEIRHFRCSAAWYCRLWYDRFDKW